jgi:TolA-binding protein
MACVLLALASPALVSADTVWLQSGQATKALERPNVKVEKLENGILSFRSTQSDRVTERPVDEVVRIAADGEPVFTQAEEAFSASRWDQAATGYQKAAASSNKQWVKDRAGLRLVAAAEKSGKFPTAVAGWLTLTARDPALAAKYKPQIPAGAKAGSLDSAVAEIDRALNDARLTEDQRQSLLAFQLEVARANGDVKKAQAIGNRLSGATSPAPAPAAAPGGGSVAAPAATGAGAGPAGTNAALALQLAFLALDQKQYQQAEAEINKAAAAIVDPEQQVEALYALAECRAGLARDDPAALKDAALAYMRAVARAKSGRVASPRLPEALLKTAAIQERLNAPREALLLYNQVIEEFKGTDAAARAAQAADRLGKSNKAGGAAGSSPAARGDYQEIRQDNPDR